MMQIRVEFPRHDEEKDCADIPPHRIAPRAHPPSAAPNLIPCLPLFCRPPFLVKVPASEPYCRSKGDDYGSAKAQKAVWVPYTDLGSNVGGGLLDSPLGLVVGTGLVSSPVEGDEQEQVAAQETDTEERGRLGSGTVTHVGQKGESAHGKVGVACSTFQLVVRVHSQFNEEGMLTGKVDDEEVDDELSDLQGGEVFFPLFRESIK